MQTIKICNVIPGMMNVDVLGTAKKITQKDYKSRRGSGKVCSILLSDQTGSIRVVLWNNEIDSVRNVREGDCLRVRGYVRAGMFGPEIMLGSEGSVEISSARPSKTLISDLKDGQRADVRAALVQLFESSPFYEVCPKCGTSFKGGEYKCVAHGEVGPAYALRVGGVIDDGSGSIRCVFFKEQAEQVLGKNAEESKDVVLRKGLGELFKSAKMKEYVFSGRVRKNRVFDRMEFVVNSISEVDAKEETKAVLSIYGEPNQ